MRAGLLAAVACASCRPPSTAVVVPSAPIQAAAAQVVVEVPPPNILLIVSDDLGWGDVLAYNPQSQLALPVLADLAAKGLKVWNAHSASAVCAPSRYSLISGNNPWRGRFVKGQWSPYKRSQLLAGQETLGGLLQRGGYVTGFFGKWHLGAQWRDANGKVTTNPDGISWQDGFFDGPADHGFDESLTALCGWQSSPYALFDSTGQWVGELPPVILDPPGEKARPGHGERSWEQEAGADGTRQAAIEFIEAHAGERFFLQYNAFQAHWHWTATGESGFSEHLDQVIEFDKDVGALLEALDAHGLRDNTLVVVTSDNGGTPFRVEIRRGHNSNAHWRGSKGEIYEGGHRVPLLVRWPEVIPEGSTLGEAHLTGLQDLYATFAVAADVGFGADQGRDSFNQLCAWAGNSGPVRRTMMVQDNRGPGFAYYDGAWKLTLDEDQQVWELFNLASDPSETTNEAPTHGGLAAAMRLAFLEDYAAARTAPTGGVLSRADCLSPPGH